MPNLHIIGAGSLLKLALHDQKFSFPVGRVQFIFLKPLSFSEFLDALGKTKLLQALSQVSLTEPFLAPVHEHGPIQTSPAVFREGSRCSRFTI